MDDARVRVAQWGFPPGAETGRRRHERGDAARRPDVAAGASERSAGRHGRAKGVARNAINDGDA